MNNNKGWRAVLTQENNVLTRGLLETNFCSQKTIWSANNSKQFKVSHDEQQQGLAKRVFDARKQCIITRGLFGNQFLFPENNI